MIRRRVTVLGSTGSVGSSTLELMEQAETVQARPLASVPLRSQISSTAGQPR